MLAVLNKETASKPTRKSIVVLFLASPVRTERERSVGCVPLLILCISIISRLILGIFLFHFRLPSVIVMAVVLIRVGYIPACFACILDVILAAGTYNNMLARLDILSVITLELLVYRYFRTSHKSRIIILLFYSY